MILRAVLCSFFVPSARRCWPVEGIRIRSGHRRILLSALSLTLLCSCSPAAKITANGTLLPNQRFEAKKAEAAAFVEKGCYVDFKKAIQLYRELSTEPLMKNKITLPFVKALILAAVRERELGILNDAYIQEASNIITGKSNLQFLVPYVDLTMWMYPKTKGIMKDIDTMGIVQVVNRTLKNARVNADMQLRARTDEVLAYLYVTFCTEYARYLEGPGMPTDFIGQYRGSILFRYKAATTYPKLDSKLLEALLVSEPEFYEADYHLGQMDLGIDRPLDIDRQSADLFEAEKHFLKAQAGIPESSQITMYLGGICIVTQELDKAVEYFDRTLAIAPTYRDALLGKSIGLGYMGKHEEAIGNLNGLVTMGSYLMGESYYWLAWNYHELGDAENAQRNVEEAKTRLPTDSEVFSLAGTLALEKGQLDKAEKEFSVSLECNGKNLGAVIGLGRVFALKKEWLDSANFYFHATRAAAQEETALAEEARKIGISSLATERKAHLVGIKEQQRRILEETRAMACFEAAVGYLNAGKRELALDLATKAAAHPAFTKAAERLIEKIKLRLPDSSALRTAATAPH